MELDIKRVHTSCIHRMSEKTQCNGTIYQLFVGIQERPFQLESWFSMIMSLSFCSYKNTYFNI
jgi:hypothetical protein